MFTGIIESLGIVLISKYFSREKILRIKALSIKDSFKRGESIAINGVCLTITNFGKDWFEVYISYPTLQTTNLNTVKVSDVVNLERALIVGNRLGGHFVSGHIDTLAIIKNIIHKNSSKLIRLNFAEKFSQHIVSKCSVALDGISLTVNNCSKNFFEVNIIPETLSNTTIAKWQIGYQANLEVDLISKYLRGHKNVTL